MRASSRLFSRGSSQARRRLSLPLCRTATPPRSSKDFARNSLDVFEESQSLVNKRTACVIQNSLRVARLARCSVREILAEAFRAQQLGVALRALPLCVPIPQREFPQFARGSRALRRAFAPFAIPQTEQAALRLLAIATPRLESALPTAQRAL